MSSISAGVNVTINRPVVVGSQLHTPLTAKSTKEETRESGSGPFAIKRETNIVDPLSRISDPPLRVESEQNKGESKDSQNSEIIQPVVTHTLGEIFLMKTSVPPIDVASVPISVVGIQTLARVNAWKQVVDMSSQLLTSKDPFISNEGTSFNLVSRLRMTAFFRLKMFDELVQEAGAIFAAEEQRLGSFLFKFTLTVPQGLSNSDKVIALQLLLIEARTMTGRGEEALQQLYALRKWISTDKTNQSPHNCEEILWWKWRTQWSIINTLIKQRQWRQGIFELQSILRDVQWKRSRIETPFKTIFSIGCLLSSEIIILCRLSRTLLQMGAIESAATYSARATTLLAELPSLSETSLGNHCILANALVLFAQDKIEESMSMFENIMANEVSRRSKEKIESPLELLFPTLSPGDLKQPEFSLYHHPLAGAVEVEESILAAATNNFAICSLHLRRIREAVRKMEELIQDDPTQNLIDPVVFNLCTMYDLSCSPDLSVEKKKALQDVAAHYHIEDLHWKSFRLN